MRMSSGEDFWKTGSYYFSESEIFSFEEENFCKQTGLNPVDKSDFLDTSFNFLEEFSKVTAAKEKDRTSVKFQDKTTNSQKFRTKLRTALPKSPDLTCQLTSLTFGTKVRTFYKTTNSQARFT